MAIAKPKEAKSSTCFSGILRRLLCIGGLPTHPADQFIESNEEEKVCEKLPESEMMIPGGVVARLMGLESFPNLSTRNRTLGSYLRSRSVNSIDFSNQLDPTKKLLHRRVRTSVSFRELGQLNNESEQLVKVDNDKLQETTTNAGKNCRVGNVACKNGKTRVNSIREIKKVDCNETLVGVKKKRSTTLNVHSDRRNVHSKSTVVTEMSRLKPSRSSYIADSQSRYSSDAHFGDGSTKALTRGKSGRGKLKKDERCLYKRMVETICSDLEENWKQGNLEEFEEICHQFGEEILQVLLKQMIDELGYAS